jgi:CRISPR/Cas system-associated protein endoribonuclease Cas2
MKHLGLNVHEAYEYVKKRRPQIAPNIGFMGQLLEYQKMINGDSSKSNLLENLEEEVPEKEVQRILPPVVEKKIEIEGNLIKSAYNANLKNTVIFVYKDI